SLEELVARIRAVLRRTGATHAGSAVLRFADLEMDDDAHEVRRGGGALELRPTEYNLLRFLLLNPRRVVSRQQILDHVWNYDFGGKLLLHATPGYPSSRSAPSLPPGLPGSEDSSAERTVFTANDATTGPSYRVIAMRVGVGSNGSPGTLVIAIPFSEIEGTLH